MCDPFLSREKPRAIPEPFVRSSSLPCVPKDHGDICQNEPELSREIKKEAPAFANESSSTDYEYLERRLREFGHSKPPPPPPQPPSNNNPSTSKGDHDLISLARAVESNSACKLSNCVVCERGLPESFHIQKPVSW
jgi:hypothetical protein